MSTKSDDEGGGICLSETAKQPKKNLPSVFTRRTGMAFGTASLVVMVILASGNFCGDGGHESEEGDPRDYIKFDTKQGQHAVMGESHDSLRNYLN